MANLFGKRILVVEDEYLLADDVAQWLSSAGVIVAGPFGSSRDVERAIAHGRLDAAVLDIGLQGESVYSLAAALAQRQVPFVFHTGYSANVIPQAFAHVPVVEKPADCKALVSAVQQVMT